MKRQVFREHIILVIEGRLFMLMLLSFSIYGIFIFCRDASSLTTRDWIFGILTFGLMFFLCGFVLHYFWYRCFGKLIITEDAVTWRCLGYLPKTIRKEELRAVGINDNRKTNVVPDVHGTGFKSVYFSTKPYPIEYDGKIDKLRNSRDFIKFPVSGKLSVCLSEWLPDPQCRKFEPIARDWTQMKRLQKRRRKEKWEKRRERIQKGGEDHF